MKKPKPLEIEYHLFRIKLFFTDDDILVVWKSMKDVLWYYEDWEIEKISVEPETVYISEWVMEDCK